MNHNPIDIKKVVFADRQELQNLCRALYSIYFSDYWENNGMVSYLDEQFGSERLSKDLYDKTIGYYYVVFKQEIVGFLKINRNADMNAYDSDTTAEIEKIYIKPNCSNQGIGSSVLNQILVQLRGMGKTRVFLDVLTRNTKAIRFYQKLGFKIYSRFELPYKDFKNDRNEICRMVLVFSARTEGAKF